MSCAVQLPLLATVNMFMHEYDVVLLPLNERGKWNGSMHAQMIDTLLSNAHTLLIGTAGKSSRPSVRDTIITGTVPGTKVPYMIELGYMEQFNPYPASVRGIGY